MTAMNANEEVVALRAQVGLLADHVGKLVHAISARQALGMDTEDAESKLAVLEHVMWKLHSRHVILKAGLDGASEGTLLH